MEGTSDDREGCARGADLKRVAKRYRREARSGFRRSVIFSLVGASITITAATIGSLVLQSDDGELARGLTLGVVIASASVPFWWQGEMSRRSSEAYRRLSLQLVLLEPYLRAFDGQVEVIMRATLAQRFFESGDGSDPLTAPVWPGATDLRDPASSTHD